MPLPAQILCRSPQKQLNSVETALKRYLCKTKHLAVLAGVLNREFSGTENIGGNCQLRCKNDDEELVGTRVGGQKHVGSCTGSQLASANLSRAAASEALPGSAPAPCTCLLSHTDGGAVSDHVWHQNATWP